MDRSRALASVEWLATATGTHSVDAWVTLGSGWGPLTSPWPAPQWTVDLGEVPGFTKPVAEGHLGSLSLFALEGVAVLVSSGRTHLYEGLGVRPVVHGVRTAAALGASMVVLTNANGSLRPDFEIGQPVITNALLDISALNAVSAYEPNELIITVQAGAPLADVLSLIEEARKGLDEEKAVAFAKKLKSGKSFDLNDFKDQMAQMRSMGGLSALMDKMPAQIAQAAGQLPAGAENKMVGRVEGIINSMTPAERAKPELIKASRKRRIAMGAGVQVQDVNRLLNQFEQMQKMMKQFSKGGIGKLMRGMKGMMPGMR